MIACSKSISGFLNPVTIDIWSQIILFVPGCLVHCGMISSIPDLCH